MWTDLMNIFRLRQVSALGGFTVNHNKRPNGLCFEQKQISY